MLRQFILLLTAVLCLAFALPSDTLKQTSVSDEKTSEVEEEKFQTENNVKDGDLDTEESRYGYYGGYGRYGGGSSGYGQGYRGWGGGYGRGWGGGYGRGYGGWGGGWGGGYGRGWGGGWGF